MQESATTTTQTNLPPDYPGLVAGWVAETIPQLEAGIHDGTLAELIEQPDVQEVVGPELVERYRVIAAEKLKHDPVFRRNWTLRFIEVFQQSIQPPLKLFSAKAANSEWSIEDVVPPPLALTHHQGDVTLRPDQVLSARRWGIWFHFDDDLLERFYLTFLVSRSRKHLASNIKNLWNIEATYLSHRSNLGIDPEWHSERRGGRFEHLMMDVLNESARVAKPAELAEDILERTDLRVTYRKIKRIRGARIQVSLVSDPKLHDCKVHALRLPDEFVLLTPLELARCAVHPPTDPRFSDFAWSDFWTALGGPQRSVHALGQELHDLFAEVLHWPQNHPLGPMWFLSPSMREFIRIFTEHRAAKTTNCVRERMEKSQKRVGSVRKYTGRYWRAVFAQDGTEAGSRAQEESTNQTGKEQI